MWRDYGRFYKESQELVVFVINNKFKSIDFMGIVIKYFFSFKIVYGKDLFYVFENRFIMFFV